MRTVRWCVVAVVTLVAALSGCRDEQAGPKGPAEPPMGPTSPMPPSAPPPQPPPSTSSTSQQQPPPHAARGAILDDVPKDLTFKSGATFGGGTVQYLGSKLEPAQPVAGQPLKMSHYFRALKKQPVGWGFFLHMVDPGTGQMLANLDHEIQGGAMPLGSWPEGKVVEDVHGILIPAGFQGSLRLLMGFWQVEQRLPVDDPKAQDGANRMIGPTFAVGPGAGAAVAPPPMTPQVGPPPPAPPASASGGPPPAENVPAYTVKKTRKAPQIDGDLSDPAWADAAPVELMGSLDGRKPSYRTTARLLYDDQNLYVSFDCEDANIQGTLFKRDDPIYTQEAVEIFIDADGDGRTYNELEVSPNNTLFDAYFPERRTGMDLAWDSGTKSGVRFKGTINNPSDRDQGWTVEMAIPLAKLAKVPHVPPKKGDSWRFNLYRLDVDQGRQEGMAFSPLFVGDFHHLPRFGRLNFD